MDRYFKKLHIAVVALGVGAACVLAGSPASALQIIVAKDNPSNAPAVYARDANGVCSKTVLRIESPNTFIATGTETADQILVYDVGPNLNWCGYVISPLRAFPNGATMTVMGRGGSDAIFGGYGGGAAHVDTIYGDIPFWVSDGDDTIWAGPASHVIGTSLNNKGNNVFLLPTPGVIAEARDGQDLFCTEVTNVFSNSNVERIDGGPNRDFRFGPSALHELNIEESGGSFNRDRCNLTFLALVGIFNQMLNS